MTDPKLTHIAPLPTKGPTVPKPPIEDAPVKNEPEQPKEPGTGLVHWKDRMVALTKATQVAEKPQGGFISFKGGRMTYQDQLLPGDKLNCIIIDYRRDAQFYDKPYDAGVFATPACHAIVRPDEILSPWKKDPATGEWVTEAENVQVKPGQTCEECPRQEWGSDLKGGAGKACKHSRRLHVFAADDCATVEGIRRASYATMIPPATSLENFQKCANQVANVLQVPLFAAVVEISVLPHPKFLYMVHYKLVDTIKDDGRMQALLERYEQISTKPIVMPKPKDAADARAARGAPTASTKF